MVEGEDEVKGFDRISFTGFLKFTDPERMLNRMVVFSADLKNVCREDIDFCVLILPRMHREAGLLTGMFQKRLTVPSIFGGYLRQKET